MIPRSILIVLATVGLSACVTSAWAEEVEPIAYPAPVQDVGQPCAEPAPVTGHLYDNFATRFVYSVVRDTKRNNCWPIPFSTTSLASA